jgi:3-isopropylmalate/(R)-2-methylmalate dehydratase small subunit
MNWNWSGRVWLFGDDIPNDEGIMPLRMCRQQEYDPQVLAKACFEQVNPAFAREARPRDIVLAGKNFGYGNPHIQGFLGLKGIGAGIVCESMSRGPLRACINAGVPILIQAGVASIAIDGDPIEVNFASGKVTNLRTQSSIQCEAMAPVMREIVAAGGGVGHMKQSLAQRQLATSS